MLSLDGYVGSHAASYKRPLLSVDVSVCVSVGNSDGKYLGTGLVSSRKRIGKRLRPVVTSSMTSLDFSRHTRDVTIFKVVAFGN